MINQENEYLVTARKWRPLKFKDIVGQEHITQTLKNAIKLNKIHHAYLFSGPRGVGKTTTARIFARAINCTNLKDNEPCNECESCKAILSGRSMDVIEIDGASNNSVDDIRKLRENAKYPPVSGKYKLYIIDEVHMLSTSAFNALLKTLEEPPKHLLFIFATTEAHKVLPTILSRCQRFDFHRMEVSSIVKQLKFIAVNEKIKIDDESLITIAQKADGSMRDSQSIFDQAVAFCGENIVYQDLAKALHLVDKNFYFKITNYILNQDLKSIFDIVKEIINRGYDLNETLSGLIEHFRNILSIIVTEKTDLIEDSSEIKKQYFEISKQFYQNDVLRILNYLTKTEQTLKYAPQPRVHFELALVQVASFDSVKDIKTLINEIKKKQLTENSIQTNEIKAQKQITRKSKINVPEVVEQMHNGTNEISDELIADNQVVYNVDALNLEHKWTEFLEKYGNGKNGLLFLQQPEFVKVKFLKDSILLLCNNSFVYDSLKAKKNKITQFLEEFYNKNIQVKIVQEEFEKNDVKTDIENTKNKEKQSISSTETNNDEEMTPIEEAIVNLFGAIRIK